MRWPAICCFVAVDSSGLEFDKYLWECLCVFCGKADNPPKMHKRDKCDSFRFHKLCRSRMYDSDPKDACGVC